MNKSWPTALVGQVLQPVPLLPGGSDGTLDRLESLSYMDILAPQFIPSWTALRAGPRLLMNNVLFCHPEERSDEGSPTRTTIIVTHAGDPSLPPIHHPALGMTNRNSLTDRVGSSSHRRRDRAPGPRS